MKDYLGLDSLFDGPDTARLLFRLGLNILFTGLVVKGIYARRYKNTEQVFTFWLFSIVTFSITFLLRKVPMELGFALGLFAVFGVLRYRTESIAIRDLTYLFVVIALALINSLANKKISLTEVLIVNAAITGAVYFLEGSWKNHESSLRLRYDAVNQLAPDNRPALLEDLSSRLNIALTRVVVHEVDLLRDTAEISVFFHSSRSERGTS